MMGSGGGAAPTQVSVLDGLLQLVGNPDAFAAKVKQLQDAAQAHDEKLAQATEREVALNQRELALDRREVELKGREEDHEDRSRKLQADINVYMVMRNALDQTQAELDRFKATLNDQAMKVALSERTAEQNIAAKWAEHRTALAQDLVAHQQQIKNGDAALAARQAELKTLEASLDARARLLADQEASVKALQSTLQQKLNALKQLVSE